jgi:hypothetical protein
MDKRLCHAASGWSESLHNRFWLSLAPAIQPGAYYLLRHIERIAARTPTVWDDALIKAARLGGYRLNIAGPSRRSARTRNQDR